MPSEKEGYLEEVPLKDLSDEEVLSLSQKHPFLFEELVRRYGASFERTAWRILKEKEKAEDAVQEAFIKIYLKASSFEAERPGAFKSWAFTVLVNTTLSLYRKEKRHFGNVTLDDDLADLIPDKTNTNEKREMSDYIASVLSRMPDHFAEVLSKFFIEGKSHEMIAREEGVTEGSVKVRLHRAKEAFREVSAKLAK